MIDPHIPPAPASPEAARGTVSRRQVIAVGIATSLAMSASGVVARADEPTANGDEMLLAISEALTGIEPLSPDALPYLRDILVASGLRNSIAELAAVDLGVDDALEALSSQGRLTAEAILEFWYAGTVDGRPIEDRASIYFDLASWKALPYIATPTLCKAFGYWETDVVPALAPGEGNGNGA